MPAGSEINNSILKLSQEHRVFLEVLEKLEQLLLEPDPQKMLSNLQPCVEDLYEKLQTHFLFEENVIFKALLVGIPTDRTIDKVFALVKQHGIFLNHLQYWQRLSVVYDAENASHRRSQHQNLVQFIDLLKVHVKAEVEGIYPMVAQNPRCLQIIGTLSGDA